MGLAIVAIPEENDRAWKISSEKVPHLTLLFLGEAENADLQQIMQFVEHAVTMAEHGPFYLDVDRRGTLGEDEADVLFYNKRSWNLKWIKQFRGQLLQNGAVKTAYDSTEQFPEWRPHLTLGYPETPAKPLPDDGFDHPIYSTAFDRIAVWPDAYEGPDFRLEWPDRELEGDLAIAYSDANKAALMHYGHDIEHHGVKGMRWGQRKTETVTVGGKTKQVTPKKAAKLDKKFEKNVSSLDTFIKLHNAAAEHANTKIPEINAAFEKKHPKEMNDGTLWNASHPVTREYHKAHNEAIIEGLNKAAASMGTNPSGTRRVKIVTENHDSVTEFGWAAKTAKVEHAASDSADSDIVFVASLDSEGRITSLKLETEDSMSQTVDRGAEFIEHYGKKGMRWGVRNDRQGRDRLSPKGHSVKGDVARSVLLPAGAGIPATVRLGKRAAPGVKKGAKKVGKGAVHVAKDVYFESQFGKDTATRQVAHAAAKNWAEKDVPRLNAQYAGTKGGTVKGRLKNPLAKETIEYRSRSRAAYRDRINEEVAKLPTNASGNRRYEIHDSGKTNANYLWTLKAVDVKRSSGLDHAATDQPVGLEDFVVRPTFDEDGFIIGFVQESASSSAEHGEAFVDGLVHGAADLGEAFILEHYGIRGMRWGRRRSEPTAVTPTAMSKVPHGAKRKTKVETKGGENHPATQDALKVEAARAKLKKSGPKALTNQELREVAERVRLEQQAIVADRSKGSAFVRSLLGNQGKQAANEVVRETIRENITSKTKK